MERNYILSEEARAAKRQYDKIWRANNKDKKKKYNHDYWERKSKRSKINNPEDELK